MSVRLYDAHNHLQDERLAPQRADIMEVVRKEGVARMVVNGTCDQDWAAVRDLVRAYPEVTPSFGVHPWRVAERLVDWQRRLTGFLDERPAGVGEIGLDCWMKDHDLPAQEEVFRWQLRLAAERNLPVSIHCLQAWGRLLEILRAEPRPQCGLVLHSYGGPRKMIGPLAELGAYFSMPGYFAHERKEKQREVFRRVPRERFLIETDAPDQLLPPECVQHPLTEPGSEKALNHPANVAAVYRFASEWLGEPMETLAKQVEENFLRVFGGIV